MAMAMRSPVSARATLGGAKDIILKPITSKAAEMMVTRLHYSGKVVPNSQLHFGIFLGPRLEGAMSFGPSMDKRKALTLVSDTPWNGFLELNRMAFSERLPKNSESRALSIAIRLIRKNYPHIEWILTYADGTQCGDGTIYRAAGFELIGIKRNTTMLRLPSGEIVADKTLNNDAEKNAGYWKKRGARPLEGFQLRYIYFLKPEARGRLTVPVLPYSAIAEAGAKMYKGLRAGSRDAAAPANHAGEGGSIPTPALHHTVPSK